MFVRNEALADQRRLALSTDETIVVPMAVFERDETGAADASNGLGACGASFSEEFAEAFSAVRILVTRCKPLSSEGGVAVGASEALTMPWIFLVSHTSLSDDLIALNAASSELILVTPGAVDLLFTWDEALSPNGILADNAAEALLMPLPCLVLHLLGASAEDFATSIATGCELGVVAVAAVDFVELGAELLVYQRHAALGAEEASLMPMLILV